MRAGPHHFLLRSLGHFALTALAATLSLASAPAQIRVACLGDSITFGARIKDRDHSSYPGWLNDYLGEDYDVRNFGVGGATMLRAADRPYHATKAFAQALAWRPHITFVILGTNDTCQNERRQNWQHADALADDAKKLVAALQAVRDDMRIVLCSPTAMFADKRGLKPERQADLTTRGARLPTCAAAMQEAASATKRVEYLELRTTLREQDVSDGVHPTAFGAERLARRIAERIRSPLEPWQPMHNALATLFAVKGIEAKDDTFHGFQGAAFALPKTKAACRVFLPRGIAKGAPWILRARFFGHQPALDIALLERGFHLAYCDVSNLYGSPEAIARYRELHALLTSLGLSQRMVLEGMSRGGLPIVNYALAHPEHVAAIYGDNPVFDIRSWPGGRSGKRSDADWQRCLKAYGLSEAQAAQFEPVASDKLQPLARADIPLLLVLGIDDEVVPIRENGDLLAFRYRQAGGVVESWRKPNNGHHPHGLHPVDPLLRAILRATGFPQNITTTPTPSVEYRSGAGWHGDSWRTQMQKMRALAKQHPNTKIVFFGDSITQGLTGSRDRLTKEGGTRAIDKAFGEHGAISLGLSGDRTEHLLYRIEHGALQELAPKIIVLQIGVNNVVTGKHTANEVLGGIIEVAVQLTVHEPTAQVLICGPFPAGKKDSATRATINRIRTGCAAINTVEGMHGTRGMYNIRYVDLHHLFLDDDGTCNANMRGDKIHISPTGQTAWMQALKPEIDKILQDR